MAKVGQLSVDLSLSVAKFSADMDKARRKVNSFAAKTNKALGKVTRGFGALKSSILSIGGLATGALFAGGTKTIAEFGEKMSEVAAVSRATSSELAAMREQAKQLGAETRFSASEAAGGMAFLARAGFNANEVLAATPPLLDLAAAGGLGLAEAADIASNIMQGFGASANEAAKFADVLAETAANSNTNIQQLGDAMKLAAPVAHSLGVSVEETSAAVGVLSNAGLQATMAGTGLRRVLTSLANPTAELKELMGGMTVETHGLTAVMQQLASQNLTTGQAMELFGDRGGTAFLVMQDGVDSMEKLTMKLRNSQGAAKNMAATMNDNLMGSFRELKSAAEGLAIALGDAGLTDILRGIIDTITQLVRWVTHLRTNVILPLSASIIKLRKVFGLLDDEIAESALLEIGNEMQKTTTKVEQLNKEVEKTKELPKVMEETTQQTKEVEKEMDILGDITDRLFSSQIRGWKDVGRIAVQELQNVIREMIRAQRTSSGGSGFGGLFGGGGGGGGFSFGDIANIGATLFQFLHGGGKVGAGGSMRRVNPAVFAGAPRFHSGGLVGDEVPIIAKKGEEVLTRQQQRDRGNGKGGNTFFIDARGATKDAIAELFRRIEAVNGSIEPRSISAVQNARFRDPNLFGGAT